MGVTTDGFVVTNDREEIIREIQNYCAGLLEERTKLRMAHGMIVAELLNQDDEPMALFRFIDERTGDWRVGYRTQDGREWFPILRQMRNTVGSGLFESLRSSQD